MSFDSLTLGGRSMVNIKDGLIDFTAGSLGGTALVFVGQPLDTVKVKMQTFPTMYKGMLDCFVKTFKSDGFSRGLYAGTVPSIVANVAENSVLFAAYGGCQKAVTHILGVPRVEDLNTFGNALSGFFAAFFSSLTLCPTELIKCRLQAIRELEAEKSVELRKPIKKITPLQMTKIVINESGYLGLFRGLSSTIAREMPGYFFFFGAYEGTRELFTKPGQTRDDIGWVKTMIAGAAGGVVLWLVIFPADLVKSRIQVKSMSQPALAVAKDVIKKEGFFALYNGLMPTLIRTMPATGTLFVTLEYSKKIMHSYLD